MTITTGYTKHRILPLVTRLRAVATAIMGRATWAVMRREILLSDRVTERQYRVPRTQHVDDEVGVPPGRC